MFKYWVKFITKNKKMGNASFSFDAPMNIEQDVYDLKTEIAKNLETVDLKFDPSEIIILDWKELKE